MAQQISGATYFARFPTITYNGVNCLDITRRVRLTDSTLRQPTLFYPYTMTSDMRADSLAYDYYGDPNAEWVTYLSNGIIDPYYGWYLSEDEFSNHIINKYGSLEDPQLRIKYWVTNYDADDTSVSVSYFNALPEVQRKYWIPEYGVGSKVIAYTRRQEDWFSSTNMIVKITITNVQGPGYQVGELVDFISAGLNIGFGEVVQVTADALFLKNLVDIYDNPSSTLSGHGGTTSTGVDITIVSQDIPLTEAIYWEPVSVWDWEMEQNEANKQLTLIDVNYIPSLLRELQQTLSV